MAIAGVEASYAFGLANDVCDNVCYLDEQHVVYPAGATLVIYNTSQHTQRFIPPSEGSTGMTAMAVSPNRRYVALAERGTAAQPEPCISIYDLHTLKRRKVRDFEWPLPYCLGTKDGLFSRCSCF